MKIFCTLILTVIVAIVVERCRAEFLLVEVEDAAGKGSMSTNTAKAREIEELARQGRIAEAKELAKDKKVEGPKQIPNLKHGLEMSARMMNDTKGMMDNKVCKWFGVSPFCEGWCPDGWELQRKDKQGDGKRCWVGEKHYCCNDQVE